MLDTHVLLWWQSGNTTLQVDVLRDLSTKVYYSSASIWELEIKAALGKLELPESFYDQLESNVFTSLPITTAHAVAAGRLPLHHADPFDRMLIAQAQVEGLTLVTRDKAMQAYPVPLLWV